MWTSFWKSALLVPAVLFIGPHDGRVPAEERDSTKGSKGGEIRKEAKQQEARQLASLIGQVWENVWGELSQAGVRIVEKRLIEEQDGHAEYILRAEGDYGNVRVMVNTTGRIDEVEAWRPNKLRPFFESVVGEAAPGVAVEEIEKVHGDPVYVEYGRHGLRMKGWLIGDYLVFVESNNGLMLTPVVGRVYAFRKDSLPPTDRMWSLNGRTTLKSLAQGDKHVEEAP